MPKSKNAKAALRRIKNSRHKTDNRNVNRNRKKKVTEPEPTPTQAPEDATATAEDATDNEIKYETERGPPIVLSNHRSSASMDASNCFQNGVAERDTSSMFNRLGYSEDVLSALPNRTWAIHCVEIPEKRIVVSSMVMHDSHGTGLEPFYDKQIIFDEKLSFDLFLINSRLVLKDKPSSIRTLHDFEDLVDYVDSMKICEGGPAVSRYSNAKPECAYKDPLDKWRHNLCSLEINMGNVCESCSSLEEILRRNVQRNKPSAKLRSPVVIPKRKQRSRD